MPISVAQASLYLMLLCCRSESDCWYKPFHKTTIKAASATLAEAPEKTKVITFAINTSPTTRVNLTQKGHMRLWGLEDYSISQ